MWFRVREGGQKDGLEACKGEESARGVSLHQSLPQAGTVKNEWKSHPPRTPKGIFMPWHPGFAAWVRRQ